MTLDIRQPEIENDQGGILGQQFERASAVGGFQDFVALRAQSHPQQFTDRRLIVDDEDLDRSCTHAAVSSAADAAGIVNWMVSTAPLRSLRLAAAIVPCIASTKPREIARPSPVPGRT